jgi:hypothetical protein
MDMAVNNRPKRGEESMNPNIQARIEALRKLPVSALLAHYHELFGEESRSSNRQFLFRRVAWRLQAIAEGDLSERARRRALELANDADLRVRPGKAFLASITRQTGRDPRLPPAGTWLRREFKGGTVEVKALDDGFEYHGRRYPSLSAIASEVAGTRWNGFLFFGLAGGKEEPRG